jgi:hypothetical protein
MTTAELIYQRSRELPEAEAHSVLDFIEFLREKLRRNTAGPQAAADMSEFDQFGAVHDDLDSLFGAWTEEEFSSIQGSISAQRQIDPELWQ